MYLVVIAILALVLTLNGPVYPLVLDTGWTLVTVAVATLLPPLVGLFVGRRVVSVLDRYPENPSRGQTVFGRGAMANQVLLGVGHAFTMLCTNWLRLCNFMPVVGDWPVVPGIIAIVPFLLSVTLVWVAVYPADRAVRQIAVELYLFRGKPLRPVWPLLGYVVFNLRHQVLFILIPMLLILLAHDVIIMAHPAIYELTGRRHAADLLVGFAALLVAVITPAILRYVWVTSRLPESPLRDRLSVLAGKLRLRCREILVWHTGGLIVNAAVMGVIAPLRYVLITDGMLEQMDDVKIEAVFGHEAGHVKRHHIFYFLLYALISGCIVTIFSVQSHELARTDRAAYELLATLVGILLLVKWGLGFGWISRRFERQADVFGARTLALAGVPCAQPCMLHSPSAMPGGRIQGDPLCSTAAHIFSDALNDVALLNGIRPEARSWRHSSIASRSRFLHALAHDPARTRRFEQTVRATKIVILVVAVLMTLWAGYELDAWHMLWQIVAAALSIA